MNKSKHSRVQIKTLLIVGEGLDEEAFLKYLSSKLVTRGAGLKVTIKNAKGKGARHVIDWTIRQAGIAHYDNVAALFDTDTDWTQAVKQQAKKHKILLLKSDPCFEAMLLRMLGITPEVDAKKLKKQFAPFVNNGSTIKENYAEHFSPEQLKAKQQLEPTIELLLNLLLSA